jgi:hypothetical protein
MKKIILILLLTGAIATPQSTTTSSITATSFRIGVVQSNGMLYDSDDDQAADTDDDPIYAD